MIELYLKYYTRRFIYAKLLAKVLLIVMSSRYVPNNIIILSHKIGLF